MICLCCTVRMYALRILRFAQNAQSGNIAQESELLRVDRFIYINYNTVSGDLNGFNNKYWYFRPCCVFDFWGFSFNVPEIVE